MKCPEDYTEAMQIDSDVLDWWKQNKMTFPCLFKAAQAYLHIPATSVPAEHIFSLAGHDIHQR